MREVGLQLCRSGVTNVYASHEDVVMMVGGPRTGKTGEIASMLLDFPGAAVVTSTRTDLLSICGPLRAERGPVYVFNAVGLGGIDSTITFDPLTGCADPVVAVERATDLLAATSHGGSGDREFWDAQARRVLAALLHAAALGGKTMSHVLSWVAKPDLAAQDVPALLRRSGVAAFVSDVEQFVGTNDRTRTSITSTVMPALGWLTHPAAAAAAQPGAGFDVEELLRSRATVFLLGAEETQAAPLVCALTGHIAREARRLAVTRPGGRLDPPLGLFLDEAALISPVPLESWTADMGGRGVTICAAFQSRAQLLARWGEHNAAAILNNTGAVVVFGGTRDRDDLLFWSTLAGERDEWTTTTDLQRPGRLAHHPAGAGGAARADREPARGPGAGHPPRPAARARARPDGLAPPRRRRALPARRPHRPRAHPARPHAGCWPSCGSPNTRPGSPAPCWRCGRPHPPPVRSRRAGAAGRRWPPPRRSGGSRWRCSPRVREPVGRWLARRVFVPLWTWLRAVWARLRLRVTGHTGEVPTYAPFRRRPRRSRCRSRDDDDRRRRRGSRERQPALDRRDRRSDRPPARPVERRGRRRPGRTRPVPRRQGPPDGPDQRRIQPRRAPPTAARARQPAGRRGRRHRTRRRRARPRRGWRLRPGRAQRPHLAHRPRHRAAARTGLRSRTPHPAPPARRTRPSPRPNPRGSTPPTARTSSAPSSRSPTSPTPTSATGPTRG